MRLAQPDSQPHYVIQFPRGRHLKLVQIQFFSTDIYFQILSLKYTSQKEDIESVSNTAFNVIIVVNTIGGIGVHFTFFASNVLNFPDECYSLPDPRWSRAHLRLEVLGLTYLHVSMKLWFC